MSRPLDGLEDSTPSIFEDVLYKDIENDTYYEYYISETSGYFIEETGFEDILNFRNSESTSSPCFSN